MVHLCCFLSYNRCSAFSPIITGAMNYFQFFNHTFPRLFNSLLLQSICHVTMVSAAVKRTIVLSAIESDMYLHENPMQIFIMAKA